MYAKGDSPLYDRGVVVTYLVAIEVPRVQFPAVVLLPFCCPPDDAHHHANAILSNLTRHIPKHIPTISIRSLGMLVAQIIYPISCRSGDDNGLSRESGASHH